MAVDRRKVRDRVALVGRRAPLIVAGIMALGLDYLFYMASGMSWLSFIVLPIWVLFWITAFYTLIAVVPPAALSLFFMARHLVGRALGKTRRHALAV
jgi:hypothetical protein